MYVIAKKDKNGEMLFFTEKGDKTDLLHNARIYGNLHYAKEQAKFLNEELYQINLEKIKDRNPIIEKWVITLLSNEEDMSKKKLFYFNRKLNKMVLIEKKVKLENHKFNSLEEMKNIFYQLEEVYPDDDGWYLNLRSFKEDESIQ
jgi:hypothetical protein